MCNTTDGVPRLLYYWLPRVLYHENKEWFVEFNLNMSKDQISLISINKLSSGEKDQETSPMQF